MCFSAEASFTASAALAVSGYALIRKFRYSKKIFAGLTACFFAIQQFAEGLVWVAFNNGYYPNSWSLTAQAVFLFFAYLFWPVWVPITFAAMEKVPWRKVAISAMLIIGIAFFLFNGYYLITDFQYAEVIGRSINYGDGLLWAQTLYAVGVLAPFFLTSLPYMWILGLCIAASFALTVYFYSYAFTSVWCFAAAVIFITAYFVLDSDRKKEKVSQK